MACRRNCAFSTQGRGRTTVDSRESRLKTAQASEAGLERDLRQCQVGRIEQPLRAADPRTSGDLQGRGPEVPAEQPPEMPLAHADAIGERFDGQAILTVK